MSMNNSSHACESNTSKRKGRFTSDIWELFTTKIEPQRDISNMCWHCLKMITYQKKSERVIAHLLKCQQFKRAMMELDVKSQPDWYKNSAQEKKLKLGSLSSSSQLSIKSFAIPHLTKSEQRRIHHNLALHYYITGSSFQWIEEEHLFEAFKIARPDIQLHTMF